MSEPVSQLSEIDCRVCHYGQCIYHLRKSSCVIAKDERPPKVTSPKPSGLTGPRTSGGKITFNV